MKTPIEDRDLTKEAPPGPGDRYGDYAIRRTVDKCRASINGNIGEYHYDCPLDGNCSKLRASTASNSSRRWNPPRITRTWPVVAAKWEQKTPQEIKQWSGQKWTR